jgi:hypothetical protein
MALEANHEEVITRRAEKSAEENVKERVAPKARPDLFARVVGFLVFALGIAIIVGVLYLAFEMWKDPNLGIREVALPPAASTPATGPTGPTATDIGIGFGRLILRIGLLFLGSISGSLIANKGIKLYFSAFADPDKH